MLSSGKSINAPAAASGECFHLFLHPIAAQVDLAFEVDDRA